MKISTAKTTEQSVDALTKTYKKILTDLNRAPDLIFVHCTANYDTEQIREVILSLTPHVTMHGSTSCEGVMTEKGMANHDKSGLALMGILDPSGNYGTGGVATNKTPIQAAEMATTLALANANCPGEVPAMIWISGAPGCEEQFIEGIGNIVGSEVPIVGGTSSDNTLTGQWKQFDAEATYSEGVVISVLFPSTEVLSAFHSGYQPTKTTGVITKTAVHPTTQARNIAGESTQRTILEIDHQPAAQVYNRWLNNRLEESLMDGGSILHLTNLNPLGRVVGYIGDIPYYQLSHPESITPSGAITLFSDIHVGDELILMKGTIDSLITRAGRVAVSALETNHLEANDIAGALIVYCAGCMLTVQDRLPEVIKSFQEALPDVPFLGTFSYGEQGCFLNGENRHGNLMISVLLFTKN